MNIPILTWFLRRKRRKCIRRMMRGYRNLKSSNQLGKITSVKEALTNTRLNQCDKRASKLIFGVGLADSEIIIRQYLLLRLAGLNLNRALLYALGKPGSIVLHPMPPEWRDVLRQNGFNVSEYLTRIFWFLYIGLFLLNGIRSFVTQNLINIKTIIIPPKNQKLGKYAYFDRLIAGALPQGDADGGSHDIISWYYLWPARVKDLDTMCHSVEGVARTHVADIPVVSIPHAIPPLSKIKSFFNYFVWSITVTINAIFSLFLNRWWNILLLKEASLAAVVRMQHPSKLARDYLFNNANWIYRPLWTYEAEKLGSQITFYFYSTNCESFKRVNGYPKLTFGWEAMNWPHYLVWDNYQSDFVRRAIGEQAAISIVGSIWFQSSAYEMPKLKKSSVAVFDVTSHRSSRYCTLGADSEFYVPLVSEKFLEHIADTSHRFDLVMLWKRKRNIGAITHPHYRNFLDSLSERDDVMLIDPDISALRVIESSCAVISMPFTSTAIIAREIGKPSVYYDPTGELQLDDRAAHGIPILSTIKELETWLSSQV
ncbi:MAG: polysaccharide biosynthesis PFTS motif protein [Pseudomonadota bacterium]